MLGGKMKLAAAVKAVAVVAAWAAVAAAWAGTGEGEAASGRALAGLGAIGRTLACGLENNFILSIHAVRLSRIL